MSAHAETIGFSQPFKERRSGKDRRRHIDPRYRNRWYPAFVDRRGGDRRKPDYEQVDPFIQEHPLHKWIVIVGVLVAIFLTYVFLFANLTAGRKWRQDTGRTRPITIGCDMGNRIARALDRAESCPFSQRAPKAAQKKA
jgi:hypothetical protein